MGRSSSRNVITRETRRKAHEMYLEYDQEVLEGFLEIIRNPEADHGHKIAALKEMNMRMFGQAPSYSNVVTEMHQNDKPLISDDAIQALSDEDLVAYAGLIRKIINAEENTVAGEISSED